MSLSSKIFILNFSYNKTVIDFNFGRHKDLSTLKSDIHLGLVASVNNHFFGLVNPYVYLIEVNNCIIYPILRINIHLKMQTPKLCYFNKSC